MTAEGALPSFDDILGLLGGESPARTVTLLRRCLKDGSFGPVPVHDAVPGDRTSGKNPFGFGWQREAEEEAPECVRERSARPGVLNTGIYCGGLRAIDVDVDDAAAADTVQELADFHLGPSPCVRLRDGTGRRLILYRAAEGQPGKRAIKCAPPGDDKVEVLGRGQQAVAYGRHWTGAAIRWKGAPGLEFGQADLPEVGEDRIDRFLAATQAWLGWPEEAAAGPRRPAADDGWRPEADLQGEMEIYEARLCLSVIPNYGRDYDRWLRVGMATHAATGGSLEGLSAWMEWSSPHDASGWCRGRWRDFTRSRRHITAGTLIWEARRHRPDLALAPRGKPAVDLPTAEETMKLLGALRRGARKR